jgi:hypothetical protein
MSAINVLNQSKFEYCELIWGDCIYGTKPQLQELGIAIGLAFPGEPDGPKRTLRVLDPRGFPTTVKSAANRGQGVYIASIRFLGRMQWEEKQWTNYAPGVRMCSDSSWCDEYVGTAVALARAGLVRLDQLPGQPGMRKFRVTILPDGSLPIGAPTANCAEARKPGAKTIERASKTTYAVFVHVSEEETLARDEKRRCATTEYEALPRPASLIAIRSAEKIAPAAPKYRTEGNVLYLTFGQ